MTATSILSMLLNGRLIHQKGVSDIRVEQRAARFLFSQAAICSRAVLWEREQWSSKTKTTQYIDSLFTRSKTQPLTSLQ